MKKKIKILSLGYSQSNFLFQLYNEIKKIDKSFLFGVDNFLDLSNGVITGSKEVFIEKFNFDQNKYTKKDYLFSLLKLLFKKKFWSFVLFEISHESSFKKTKKFIKSLAINKLIIDSYILPLKYNIYHFHFCTEENLIYIHFLPKTAKIVCSFWGSDLYRVDNKRNNFYVETALKRANAITIQTSEMGKDLFKKHGNWIKDKIHYVLFAIEKTIYNNIDLLRNESNLLNSIKSKYLIPKGHIVLAIGYNANKAFNHIEILKMINSLDIKLKERLTVIFSLTYSRNESYLEKLKEQIKQTKDVNIVCFDEFLNHMDIAKLRLITDIQIQMPVSDALSGSVTEILYAGNIVIAGDWLPYGIYKRNGISIKTVKNIEELKSVVPEAIKSLKLLKSENNSNPKKIANHFFPDKTIIPWVKLYNNLVAEF